MYQFHQHCASCIPLSHANRPNVVQHCQVIRLQQPNATIEISAYDRYVPCLNASISEKVQHIIHLFHCAIRIPSRWKANQRTLNRLDVMEEYKLQIPWGKNMNRMCFFFSVMKFSSFSARHVSNMSNKSK